GPISAAMAALAMADKSLTDTDKADLISVLNKATGDYLSGADTESLLELNTALSRFGAKSTNKQFQQFIKEKVENNVATSQKGNKSSKFGEHVKNENQITENWNNTNQAHNAANSPRHNAELVGKEIAHGHAYYKHVIKQEEFKDLGITTKEQFAKHIENVVSNYTSFKELSGGRTAYWHEQTGTVVIRNPKAKDGGTAFRPVDKRKYFDDLR
ncbi:hypothetical protein, partial [Gilliamella sp. Bim1-2]